MYITGNGRIAENSYFYDAFGNVLEGKENIENCILYTGQQYDQETGQYYLRARFYNPVIGRFTQEDTYRGDGLNLYAYCGNNPVMYYDPSGYASCESQSTTELDKPKTAGENGNNSISEKLVDGSSMKTNDALDLASEFLGEGYTEPKPGSGRFVSSDGTKVFRMGENDILGRHGGGPHVNFEILEPNPAKPGKMQVIKDIHIFLED